MGFSTIFLMRDLWLVGQSKWHNELDWGLVEAVIIIMSSEALHMPICGLLPSL